MKIDNFNNLVEEQQNIQKNAATQKQSIKSLNINIFAEVTYKILIKKPQKNSHLKQNVAQKKNNQIKYKKVKKLLKVLL